MNQYELVLVNLDPTIGSEIKKTRPCIIISPNEMNDSLSTIIIAPITSNKKKYPTRVKLASKNVSGMIVLDQIRTVDKKRVIKSIGKTTIKTNLTIKDVLKQMLIY